MNYAYQVTACQVIYPDGRRDSIKFNQPILSNNIEDIRQDLKEKYGCSVVNLSYTEYKAE